MKYLRINSQRCERPRQWEVQILQNEIKEDLN